MEFVLLRAPEDGDHQPRAADADQRGDHPALGLGERAQRGLQAARRRVDNGLQEHLWLPEVRHSSPRRFLGFSVKNLSYWLFRILSVPSKIPCKGAFSGFILCLQAWKHLQSRTVHAKSWSQEESWCSLKNLKNQCSLSTLCFSFEKKVVLFSLDSSALWWSQLVRIKLIKIWNYTFSYS